MSPGEEFPGRSWEIDGWQREVPRYPGVQAGPRCGLLAPASLALPLVVPFGLICGSVL